MRPILRLFFVCEDAVVNFLPQQADLQFGWWEIRKPLFHVWMPDGFSQGLLVPELCLYYQLTGGHGDYHLFFEFEQLDLAMPKKTRKLKGWGPIHVHCPDRLAVIEDVVTLSDIPFPKPEMYRFSVKESGETLVGGETYLNVFSGDHQ